MLHKTLMFFFTMRQGESESNDLFLNRFKSNVQNLELVGGRKFLYITENLDLSGGVESTNTYRNK